jgi:hypothetical protein
MKILVSASMLLCVAVAGCAGGLKEVVRGIEGNSTKVLYETRVTAAVKEFACPAEDCRQRAGEILGEMKTYVYRQEGELTAIFVSQQDTTPVGIFVTAAGEDRSRIEVSSPSSAARELIARQLFTCLENSLKTKKIDVQLDSIEGK